MNRYRGYVLFLAAVLVYGIAAMIQRIPGYMDAEYYYTSGVAFTSTGQYVEPYLWNYLNNPDTIESPANSYWMPAATLLTALSSWLFHTSSFGIVRLIFLLIAAFIPPLTASLAYTVDEKAMENQRHRRAWMAGLLAVFPGYYLTLLTLPETFGLYMVFGTLFLMLGNRTGLLNIRSTEKIKYCQKHLAGFGMLGVLAGMMHLSRADGLIWLAAGFGLWLMINFRQWKDGNLQTWSMLASGGLLVCGYLAVMGWWLGRNFLTFGSFLPPGGSLTIWLTEYDQTFAYPARSVLNFTNWWAGGIWAALMARLQALWMNLKNLLGVQGLVFWLPLAAVGGWKLRRHTIVWAGLIMWLTTLAVMTLVFPFSGARGGYLHSSAALQPLVWVLAVIGFEESIRFFSQKRGWDASQSFRVLGSGLILITVFATGFIYYLRVIGPNPAEPLWEQDRRVYQRMDATLSQWHIGMDTPVMINEPPGFFAATGRKAIVIPYGDTDTLIQVACRYGARDILVDRDLPKGLMELFSQPGTQNGLELRFDGGDFLYYFVRDCP